MAWKKYLASLVLGTAVRVLLLIASCPVSKSGGDFPARLPATEGEKTSKHSGLHGIAELIYKHATGTIGAAHMYVCRAVDSLSSSPAYKAASSSLISAHAVSSRHAHAAYAAYSKHAYAAYAASSKHAHSASRWLSPLGTEVILPLWALLLAAVLVLMIIWYQRRQNCSLQQQLAVIPPAPVGHNAEAVNTIRTVMNAADAAAQLNQPHVMEPLAQAASQHGLVECLAAKNVAATMQLLTEDNVQAISNTVGYIDNSTVEDQNSTYGLLNTPKKRQAKKRSIALALVLLYNMTFEDAEVLVGASSGAMVAPASRCLRGAAERDRFDASCNRLTHQSENHAVWAVCKRVCDNVFGGECTEKNNIMNAAVLTVSLLLQRATTAN